MAENEFNPFAAPQAVDLETRDYGTEVEETRKQLIAHETSVKSLSLLYFIGGVLILVAAFLTTTVRFPNTSDPLELIFRVLFAGFGAFQILVAVGLRRLSNFGRIGGTFLAVLGLLSIPVGTIISIYILYLFWSNKGGRVFEPGYKEVIQQTPHIKYKTSIFVKILLAILIALIVLGLIGALVGFR